MAYAHSRNRRGLRHDLVDHLRSVAALASDYASAFDASESAYYLGLWHDVGKFSAAFQQYLADAEAGQARARGPDHKAAGARLALEQHLGPLMLLLQGHHGGMKDRTELQRWYADCVKATDEALTLAHLALPDLLPSSSLQYPPYAQPKKNRLPTEFFLRFLFSALVDADFLDTERHFTPAQSAYRGTEATLAELWEFFAEDQHQFQEQTPDSMINRIREAIYQACLTAAALPPGLFRLTVPTGGGKTRSALAFALRHASLHGQKRVIVAMPFTSITEQTARVYRDIFEKVSGKYPVVLEHHSGAVERGEEADEYAPDAQWSRLAAENWDAPIIVTTTVQLFESLFANTPRRCRKVHRLANSVIIIDEAQALPVQLLDPILDGLQALATHYGTTVVLSTATQPTFELIPTFAQIQAREIIPNPLEHFKALSRVEYEWRMDRSLSWLELADIVRAEPQVLTILNTKQDALALLDMLADPTAFHLSTLLCGAHRADVIQEVKHRLAEKLPCRLISTQVVEAGVDLDFPLVLRAFSSLSSIVQAAGRANREGKLAMKGRVVIFEPAEGGMPRGAYQRAAHATRTLLGMGPLDLDDPLTMQRYFEHVYPYEDTDLFRIQEKRRAMSYLGVAQAFRMIDEDTISVVITDYGSAAARQEVQQALAALRQPSPATRDLLRRLQPYLVALPSRLVGEYEKRGFLAATLLPEVWEWMGEYDAVRGLSATDKAPESWIF